MLRHYLLTTLIAIGFVSASAQWRSLHLLHHDGSETTLNISHDIRVTFAGGRLEVNSSWPVSIPLTEVKGWTLGEQAVNSVTAPEVRRTGITIADGEVRVAVAAGSVVRMTDASGRVEAEIIGPATRSFTAGGLGSGLHIIHSEGEAPFKFLVP